MVVGAGAAVAAPLALTVAGFTSAGKNNFYKLFLRFTSSLM